MAFMKPGTKAAAPVAAAAKKNDFIPSKPVATLSVQGAGEDKAVIITGLFENVSKKGDKFLSGKDKESGVKYFLQMGKQGEKLSYTEDGKTYIELCVVETKQGKNGPFKVGVDKENNKFLIFPKTPRE